MRNVQPEDYDATPRPVVAVGNDFRPGHVVAAHRHRRCQFLYSPRAVLSVATEHGAWVVPPDHCLWLPAGVEHEVTSHGPLLTRSLFFEPNAVADMPARCRVLSVSPLMRSLVAEAVAAGKLTVQGFRFDIHTGVLSRVLADGVEPVN